MKGMAVLSSDLWKSENQTPYFFLQNVPVSQIDNCFTHRFAFIIFWLGMFYARGRNLPEQISIRG